MSNQVERVERAHPRWRVWQAEESALWWASVRVNLTPNQQRAGCVPHLSAETLAELDALLREEDRRAERASHGRVGTPMHLRAWGVTEADIEHAIRKAGQSPSRNQWDFTEVERLTGPACPLDVRNPDPKSVAADFGYHWAYIAFSVQHADAG